MGLVCRSHNWPADMLFKHFFHYQVLTLCLAFDAKIFLLLPPLLFNRSPYKQQRFQKHNVCDIPKCNPWCGRMKACWWNQASMKQDSVQDDVLSMRTLFKTIKAEGLLVKPDSKKQDDVLWKHKQHSKISTARCRYQSTFCLKPNELEPWTWTVQMQSASMNKQSHVLTPKNAWKACQWITSSQSMLLAPNPLSTPWRPLSPQLLLPVLPPNSTEIATAWFSSVFTLLAICPFTVTNGCTTLSLRRGECDDAAAMWQSVHLPWHRQTEWPTSSQCGSSKVCI